MSQGTVKLYTLEFPWSRVRGEGRWEPWESGEPVGKGFGGRPRGCRGRATVNVTTFVLVLKKAMSGLMYHILIHAPQRLKLCMVHVG